MHSLYFTVVLFTFSYNTLSARKLGNHCSTSLTGCSTHHLPLLNDLSKNYVATSLLFLAVVISVKIPSKFSITFSISEYYDIILENFCNLLFDI